MRQDSMDDSITYLAEGASPLDARDAEHVHDHEGVCVKRRRGPRCI